MCQPEVFEWYKELNLRIDLVIGWLQVRFLLSVNHDLVTPDGKEVNDIFGYQVLCQGQALHVRER